MPPASARLEHGWPIVRRTACRVGQHVFMWTGTVHGSEEPCDPHLLRCDCGALSYAEAQKQTAAK